MLSRTSWSSFKEPEEWESSHELPEYASILNCCRRNQRRNSHLIEESRYLFATSALSTAAEAEQDSFARNSWLVSVPVLHKLTWDHYLAKLDIYTLVYTMFKLRYVSYLTSESMDDTFPFPRSSRESWAVFHCCEPVLAFAILQISKEFVKKFKPLYSLVLGFDRLLTLTIGEDLLPGYAFWFLLQQCLRGSGFRFLPCRSSILFLLKKWTHGQWTSLSLDYWIYQQHSCGDYWLHLEPNMDKSKLTLAVGNFWLS